ncbi:MAG: solute-binding protein [Leptolyngbya sp. SIO3F4]|nr:solute-binding protein [Leptolyngbya sp. SIO3F4]
MQQQQDKSFLVIILISVGLITAVFGAVLWTPQTSVKLPLQQNDREEEANNKPATSSSKLNPAAIKNVPNGIFNYGGSTTWIPVHETVNNLITDSFPEFELRYVLPANGLPGSSTGVKMLLEGELSFSESSRPLKVKEHDEAEKRGFKLEQVPIAIDGIAIAVSPDINLPGLSVDQLQKIYTGQIKNWAEVGGSDMPIRAYSKDPEKSGTAKYFLESLLDAEAYGESVEFVSETTPTLKRVISEPGGIFYASAPEVVKQCSTYALPIAPHGQPGNFIPAYEGSWRAGEDCLAKANTVDNTVFRDGSYPLTRRLFVIVKVDGDRDEDAGRAYSNILLSPEGQEMVQEAGFVGVR